LGFGTTSAAPLGGKAFFVVNGTAGACPPAAPPKFDTCSRITASAVQFVPFSQSARPRERIVTMYRVPSTIEGSVLQPCTGGLASVSITSRHSSAWTLTVSVLPTGSAKSPTGRWIELSKDQK
jgi:hypothetical protein